MSINLITGTAEGEDLTGTEGRDRILAGGGDDAVDANGGDDIVYGDDGDDLISGGAGDDRLFGGAGNDRIVASFVGSTDRDFVRGGDGDDVISVNSLNGGEVHGGRGFDTLSMAVFVGNVAVSIAIPLPGKGPITNPNGLVISSIEALSISTGTGDDTISGGAFSDYVQVRGGANVVDARGGSDFVQYNTGSANLINSGGGEDTVRVVHFVPGPLEFSVSGNTGTDNFGSMITNTERFEIYGGADDDRVFLGSGNDLFSGGDGNDLARGRDGADTLKGGAGDDTLLGGGGDDKLSSGDGNDELLGGDGNDSLASGRGDDWLQGGAGRDRLRGDDGNDTLNGGEGRDVLAGGQGADVFVFDSPDGIADVVRDMTPGTDEMQILGSLLGDALDPGVVAAQNLSYESATGDHAQFVYATDFDTGYGQLWWDTNGAADGGATPIARLWNNPDIAAADLFIL